MTYQYSGGRGGGWLLVATLVAMLGPFVVIWILSEGGPLERIERVPSSNPITKENRP